ncbi:hypothetical protein LZ31DRAFT_156005 [Colletotrichum somersetense]|nr:hypothetical protein LZ31DRAFT_156005 [Colletotrichum somersetense]
MREQDIISSQTRSQSHDRLTIHTFHSIVGPFSLDATFSFLSPFGNQVAVLFAAGQSIILFYIFKMQYPTFGHFLLASILAVQGAHSFSLTPAGQVAQRYAAPALALALPILAAPQPVSIEAREPHHKGKKTKGNKGGKRDELTAVVFTA